MFALNSGICVCGFNKLTRKRALRHILRHADLLTAFSGVNAGQRPFFLSGFLSNLKKLSLPLLSEIWGALLVK
jgi:hypothetical protein